MDHFSGSRQSDYLPPDTRYFRGAVGIEPMICGPNALATGEDLIVLLLPGQHGQPSGESAR